MEIFKLIFEYATHPIIVTDSAGKIILANESAEKKFTEELIDKSLFSLNFFDISESMWQKHFIEAKVGASGKQRLKYENKYFDLTSKFVEGEDSFLHFFTEVTEIAIINDAVTLLKQNAFEYDNTVFNIIADIYRALCNFTKMYIGQFTDSSLKNIKTLGYSSADSTQVEDEYFLAHSQSKSTKKNTFIINDSILPSKVEICKKTHSGHSYILSHIIYSVDSEAIGILVIELSEHDFNSMNYDALLFFLTRRISIELQSLSQEEILNSRDHQLRVLIDSLPFDVWSMDKNGVYTLQNFNSINNWGLLTGKNLEFTDLPESIKANWKSHCDLALSGKRIKHSFEFIKDGKISYFENLISPVITDDGISGIVGANINVTERINAERNLQISELKYRTLFSKLTSGFALLKAKHNETDELFNFEIEEFNQALEVISGVKEKYAVGKLLTDVLPTTAKNWIERFRKVYLFEDKLTFEYYSEIWNKYLEITAYVVSKDRVAVLISDISIRKRTEQSVRDSETKLRFIATNANEILSRHTLEGSYFYVSPSTFTITGYTEDELIGKMIYNFIHPDDVEITRNSHSIMLQDPNTTQTFVYRYRRKNGTYVWFETAAKAITDPFSDSPYEIFSSSRDITQRVIFENDLRKLSVSIEQSPVSVVITDIEAHIEYVNPKYTEVSGYSKAEVMGKNPSVLKSGKMSNQFYTEMWQTITSGAEWKGEILNRRKDGTFFWESVVITPIKDNKGRITNYLAVKEDITQRKALELEIRQALDRAEEASALKSNLLSNMSHELRTPMNGILGFTQILQDEIDDEFLNNITERIVKSGNRLMNTLNSILNLSEFESKHIDLHLHETNLATIAEYSAKSFEDIALEKKLEFKTHIIDSNICGFVDPNLFSQVIQNMLDNAFKYTTSGSVTIEIDSDVTDKGRILAVTRIIDTGIGISPEYHDIIFEEFRQVSEGFNRQYEGSGLGLTLARKYINAFGGNIVVKSDLNEGSIFEIRVPGLYQNAVITEAEETTTEIIQLPTLANQNNSAFKRILLVEDNSINRDLIYFYISELYNLDFASNGVEAISKARSISFDLILMDINLGIGIDGIEVLKAIRESSTDRYIPIIAVTGYAMREDKGKLLSQGFDNYLSKPFTRKELVNLLETTLNENK